MAQLKVLLSTFFLVLTAVTLVECFPGGAGTQACVTLVPLHGTQPQPAPVPYQITLSQSTFAPGDQILVTVDATPGNTNVYRGLALQARPAVGSTDTTGTFTILPNDQSNFRFYDCADGSPTGGVTHTNRNDKSLPQRFLWTPSDGFTGDVQFRLTVVREFSIFWTDIPSAVLRLQQGNNLPVVTCPGPVSVQSLPNNVGNRATFLPTCTDLDQSDASLDLTCSPASNSFFPLGTTPVVCICTDNQGETDTCTIPVTINPVLENTPPAITCPGSVSVRSFQQIEGNFVSWDAPICTDVDQPGINLASTCEPASGSFFQGLGTTVVTCTCSDNQRATDTCTISVTITSFTDVNTLPVVTCPGPVSVQSLPNNVGNRATFLPTCTDLDQSDASLDLTCSPASNSFFQLGTTPVVCTCTDNQGATDTCTISVTISPVGQGGVCDGNPCFPNECRVSLLSGPDRYTCHSTTGAPCPER
ncbi:Ferric-chelate reductase 1 [Holothuria leucospilota]|uniref:Ferric-chelate reductase 1 n=1 Tax=Holothuria leucospilota TaxID=206669 RepID=A0A9Q0YLM3_HOLLE|nr:Ferric-chelate reductase 1 [Holothuria leucospilota]